jgi:hypothetical protein
MLSAGEDLEGGSGYPGREEVRGEEEMGITRESNRYYEPSSSPGV